MGGVDQMLRVLACDAHPGRLAPLCGLLERHAAVAAVTVVNTLREAKSMLVAADVSVAFVGLSGLGVYEASDLIFTARRKVPRVVFVLFDVASTRLGSDFYRGERSRLMHYYRLDIGMPVADLPDAVDATLSVCLMDLGISPTIRR
jgi:hypothetical protein